MKSKLIRPMPVEIQNVDTSETVFDADFEEATGDIVYEDVQTVNCQVVVYSTEKMEAAPAGFQLKGDGYLLMKEDDSASVNVNAKIVKIGSKVVEYYVTEKTRAVHYEDAEMVLVFFESHDKGEP